MDQPADKISSAVATCLNYAAAAQNPVELADDLALLLQSAGWTEGDISQIQQRVQTCLMRRRATDGIADPALACVRAVSDCAALPPGAIERRRNRPSGAM